MLASNDKKDSIQQIEEQIPVVKRMSLKKGNNRLKLVAKSMADTKLELKIDEGKFIAG